MGFWVMLGGLWWFWGGYGVLGEVGGFMVVLGVLGSLLGFSKKV